MSFDLGSTYERQSDRMTAIVAKIDEQNALLWLSTGEEEWITPADVPSLWRRYEACPACNSLNYIAAVDDDKCDFTKRPTTPDCPMCQGSGRIYP
jgi:hypothetical protein